MSNKMDPLIEKMIENLHEVTPDQIKPGEMVMVYHVMDDEVDAHRPTENLVKAWRNNTKPRRFFLAEKPAPEYEPGTLARITTRANLVRNAIRSEDYWVDDAIFRWEDNSVSTVEVIAYPDGTRPPLVVTDYDVKAAKHIFLFGSIEDALVRAVLEDFAARKNGDQA